MPTVVSTFLGTLYPPNRPVLRKVGAVLCSELLGTLSAVQSATEASPDLLIALRVATLQSLEAVLIWIGGLQSTEGFGADVYF